MYEARNQMIFTMFSESVKTIYCLSHTSIFKIPGRTICLKNTLLEGNCGTCSSKISRDCFYRTYL